MEGIKEERKEARKEGRQEGREGEWKGERKKNVSLCKQFQLVSRIGRKTQHCLKIRTWWS